MVFAEYLLNTPALLGYFFYSWVSEKLNGSIPVRGTNGKKMRNLPSLC